MLALIALCHGCFAPDVSSRVAPASVSGIERMHGIDPRLSTGSSPDSHGYRELRALGVDIVLSVDGPPPPVDLIRELGMRSIHLPIGYDGVPPDVLRSLVRLAEEAPDSNLYVHCHQGRHRGPTVAAILLRLRGSGSVEDASAILSVCGTSPEYVGLWASAEGFVVPEGDCRKAPLPERVEPDPLVLQMDRIQKLRDSLDDFASKAGSRSNILLLKDAFVELQRLHRPATAVELQSWDTDIDLTIKLLESLRAAPSFDSGDLARIDARCDSCHAATRH